MHRFRRAAGLAVLISSLFASAPALGAKNGEEDAEQDASENAPEQADSQNPSEDADPNGEAPPTTPSEVSNDDPDTDVPDPSESKDRAHLRVEALTDFPVQAGGGALFEFPGPFRLGGSLGVLPRGYVKVANDVLVPTVDSYTETEATLVENVLETSMVWRAYLGLQPVRELGFYIHTGYTLVTLGGTATRAGSLVELVEKEINPERAEERFRNRYADEQLKVNSTLHQWDIEIGWDWRLADRLRLRTALGWSYTFAASTTMEAQFQSDNANIQSTIDALERAGEGHLNETYRKSIHPPWLTVALGWRFF